MPPSTCPTASASSPTRSGAKVIVEVDGFETHGTRSAFEADRVRDAELQILGWRVLRTTWRQLERTPHEFIDRLRRLLRTAG
jgi:very-short-patch-repair endonuclease